MDKLSITIIKNAVHRPDEPRHFMVMEDVPCGATATALGKQIACAGCNADKAIKLKEVGKTIYDPVLYFPRETVNMDLLEKSNKASVCPLKGTASYYHLTVCDNTIEDAAWSYQDILDFDERLENLKNRIAFGKHIHTMEIK